MILLIIDKLAYRLDETGKDLEFSPVFWPYSTEARFNAKWDKVPAVALRTPRQEAILAHIKAALETAEISQL